jgi:hypothetical protein
VGIRRTLWLTEWLAIQAGFDPTTEARAIAKYDQGVDDSWITGPMIATVVASCIPHKLDPKASLRVHDEHFPSAINPPATPHDRGVKAAAVFRDKQSRDPPKLDDSDGQLNAFGSYLHAFQDTWSHQGVPDIPPPCDEHFAWGHAKERGGWSCHLADVTSAWPQDVAEMAEGTYQILVDARQNKSPAPWVQLLPQVRKFAAAQSKWEKDA